MKCKRCNGEGVILILWNDHKPHKLKIGDGLEKCHACKGTGIKHKGNK